MSVLGPILFLIYISDITDDLASLLLIYADDTTFPYQLVVPILI